MYIHFGKSQFKKRLGYVADFCPYCRDFQTVALTNIIIADHVNGMQASKGTFLRLEAACTKCRGIYSAESISRFPLIGKKLSADVEMMLINTQPDAREHYAARLSLERRLRESPSHVEAAEREQLLGAPFNAGQAIAAEIASGNRFDLYGVIIVVVGLSLLGYTGFWIANKENKLWLILPVFVAIVTLGGVVQASRLAAIRHVRKVFLAPLQSALSSLRPTRDELTAFWPELTGHAFGKVFKMEDFLAPEDVLRRGIKPNG